MRTRDFARMLLLVGAGALVAACVHAEYWIAWEGEALPEEQGWTREFGYGGDVRTLENGWLVLDGRANPRSYDVYVRYMYGTLDPAPGFVFRLAWRVRVDALTSPYFDPGVGISSDDRWLVAFDLNRDTVRSRFEQGVSAHYAPGVPHDFEMRSPDMRTYDLFIDGQLAVRGSFWSGLSWSSVGWGDLASNTGSLARWDYIRFGTTLPGDLDCDGRLDFDDINPFVLALSDPHGYAARYPSCWIANGDLNNDGRADFRDINPFVQLLIGQADGSARRGSERLSNREFQRQSGQSRFDLI
ncbi:MAG: hypothetical protein AB1716_10280 [Planctomycetota bacterium]